MSIESEIFLFIEPDYPLTEIIKQAKSTANVQEMLERINIV